MTLRSIFSELVANLRQNEYGTKITDKDGALKDTGVQAFVEDFLDALNSNSPINIDNPIQINNNGTGPAFLMNNQGDSPVIMEMYAQGGQYASVGVGLGNEGIVSNEFIPLPWYAIDSQVAHQKYTNAGEQGGVADSRPPDPRIFPTWTYLGAGPTGTGILVQTLSQPVRRTRSAHPGIGLTSVKEADVGTGYGLELSGSGYRFDARGGNDTFHVFPEPFGSPNANTGSGGGSGVYGTIASIEDDYITVTPISGTGTLIVAKPYYLRRSTFDTLTVDGIEYTYSDSQTRIADNGSGTEDQEIVPPYVVGDGIMVIATPDGNGVTDATHMDANSDARTWAKTSTGCG